MRKPSKKYSVKRHVVVQPSDPNCKLIPLTRGLNALVDTDDYDRLMQFNWVAWRCSWTGKHYAKRHVVIDGKQTMIGMHEDILRAKWVDHVDNGNTLDNRRVNLRHATPSQNTANRGRFRNNKSGYKGVYSGPSGRRWRADLRHNGKTIHLGSFATPELAHEAYKIAAVKYHGEFARFA